MNKLLRLLVSPFYLATLVIGGIVMVISWIIDDKCKSIEIKKNY